MIKLLRKSSLLAVPLITGLALSAQPGYSAAASSAAAPVSALTYAAHSADNDTVTVEEFSKSGRLLSKRTYGAETKGVVMGGTSAQSKASASGGTSSASGCRKYTVNNEEETFLGFTAFYYHTWTRWCWTRSTQNIYDVTTGQSISDVDANFHWRGEQTDLRELLFYDYSTNDGHPRSAYKHYRVGKFENCVIREGCIGVQYPANTLRSYYNGTWAWTTSG